MNQSYKRGLYRHERRESGRGTERQRNGRAHVKGRRGRWDVTCMQSIRLTKEIGAGSYASLSPGLLPPFSPLSFAPLALLQSLGWGIRLLYSYLIMKVNKRSIVALKLARSQLGGFPKAIGGPGLWQTLVVTWVWMLILWRHQWYWPLDFSAMSQQLFIGIAVKFGTEFPGAPNFHRAPP